ncbi:argonaute-like protein [Moniliophthora roreri]|nr:argonaute-like protein [Moniliophthora roreri]
MCCLCGLHAMLPPGIKVFKHFDLHNRVEVTDMLQWLEFTKPDSYLPSRAPAHVVQDAQVPSFSQKAPQAAGGALACQHTNFDGGGKRSRFPPHVTLVPAVNYTVPRSLPAFFPSPSFPARHRPPLYPMTSTTPLLSRSLFLPSVRSLVVYMWQQETSLDDRDLQQLNTPTL